MTTPIEEVLNNLYVKAWAIVEDLSMIEIDEDDPIRENIDAFVRAARRSFDTIKSRGYAEAWEDLSEMSAGFMPLCMYKDQHLPNVDADLPRECREAYLALPDPAGEPVNVDASLVHEINVKRMEEAYGGQSRYVEPATILQYDPTRPASRIS